MNRNRMQQLEKNKYIYIEKKMVLDDAMKSTSGASIHTDDIIKIQDKLIALKHNGKDLKDFIDEIPSVGFFLNLKK